MLEKLKTEGLLPEQMLAKVSAFTQRIEMLAEQLQLELHDFQADHIALRINDPQLAAAAHQAWLAYGEEISSTQINGRPIIVLAFAQPICVNGWSIECLELPYPAAGKVYPLQDWEHIEFVIPSMAQTAEQYVLDLRLRFPSFSRQWPQLESLGIKVKLSSPQGEGERLVNPTIAFKFQGVCLKLHPHRLKTIIASEAC